MTDRQCNNCGACCITMGIKEIGSQPYDKPPCLKRYVGGLGRCSIYDNKPQECVDYRCGWLKGLFDDRHRPDLSGILCDMGGPENEPLVVMIEARPNARKQPLALEMRAICKSRGIAIAMVEFRTIPDLGGGEVDIPIILEGGTNQIKALADRATRYHQETGKTLAIDRLWTKGEDHGTQVQSTSSGSEEGHEQHRP